MKKSGGVHGTRVETEHYGYVVGDSTKQKQYILTHVIQVLNNC